jgi:hypothetical protein
MNERFVSRTKEAKTGQKSRTPCIFFFPFIGFCRSLLAERTATLIPSFENVPQVQILDSKFVIQKFYRR